MVECPIHIGSTTLIYYLYPERCRNPSATNRFQLHSYLSAKLLRTGVLLKAYYSYTNNPHKSSLATTNEMLTRYSS